MEASVYMEKVKYKLSIMLMIVFLLSIISTSFCFAQAGDTEGKIEEINVGLPEELSPEEIEQIEKESAERYAEIVERLKKYNILDFADEVKPVDEKRYAEILKVLKKENRHAELEKLKELDVQNFKGDISPLWFYELIKNLDVPHHKQVTGYYCGPASILQMIDYNDREAMVSGNTSAEKQHTLADESNTVEKGSNTVKLRDVLNNYLSDIHYYNPYTINSTDDKDKLWNIIKNNIMFDEQPVLVLVNTKYLPYYNGRQSFHYIVVDGIREVYKDGIGWLEYLSTVRVVDPHYDRRYSGYHEVYFDDLFKAMKGYYESTGEKQRCNMAY